MYDTACSVPVQCIAVYLLAWEAPMEILQICRRKLLSLLIAYIPVLRLFEGRDPLCCVSAKR